MHFLNRDLSRVKQSHQVGKPNFLFLFCSALVISLVFRTEVGLREVSAQAAVVGDWGGLLGGWELENHLIPAVHEVFEGLLSGLAV